MHGTHAYYMQHKIVRVFTILGAQRAWGMPGQIDHATTRLRGCLTGKRPLTRPLY